MPICRDCGSTIVQTAPTSHCFACGGNAIYIEKEQQTMTGNGPAPYPPEAVIKPKPKTTPFEQTNPNAYSVPNHDYDPDTYRDPFLQPAVVVEEAEKVVREPTYADLPETAITPTVARVLSGLHSSDVQARIAEVGLDIVETLLRKNTDYGASVFKAPKLAPTLAANAGILVRLSDKVERLERLLAGNQAEVGESIADTMKDLAGYAILYLVADSDKG